MEPNQRELQPAPAARNIAARFEELRTRCEAHHEQLVSIAGYAVALVDACRDEARQHAERIVRDAYAHADAILRQAQQDADAIRAAAHEARAPEPARLPASVGGDSRETAPETVPPSRGVPAADPPAAAAVDAAPPVVPVVLPEPSRPNDAWGAERFSPEPVTRSARNAIAVMGIVALAILTGGWLLQRSWSASPSDQARRIAAPSANAAIPPAPSAAPVATDTTPASAPADPSPLSVVISAERTAWVRVVADGAPSPGGFIKAGERRSVTAARELTIRAGDAGALQVSVNGAAPVKFGRDGAVLTARATIDHPAFDGAPRPGAAPASAPGTAPVERVAERAAAAPGLTPGPTSQTAGQPGGVATAGTVVPHAASGAGADEPARAAILGAERAWFAARYRGDRATMASIAAPDFQIVDERAADQRAATSPSTTRELRGVTVETWGDNAVVSGQMLERASGQDDARVTTFAETWVRRDGRWQMLGLRLR